MKLKWKDIYNSYKQRRYCEITGIKEEGVEIISNSFATLKEKKYLFGIISLAFLALLVYTLKSDIKTLLMVLIFFVIVSVLFFIFNYYKLKCTKDGLYVRFGIQEGVFPYDKVKSIYLSKFSDYNIIIPSKTYNIVIRYVDKAGKIKELAFSNYFIHKEEMIDFINNFTVKEAEVKQYVQYERLKTFKRVAKSIVIIVFVLSALALLVTPVK